MAGMNVTFDSEISQMLDFYRSVADRSDARLVRQTCDVTQASPPPPSPSPGYRPILQQPHQGRGGDRR